MLNAEKVKVAKWSCLAMITVALVAVPARAAGGTPEAKSAQAAPAEPSFVRSDDKWVKLWNYIEPSILWYLNYAWGEENGQNFNRAHVSRGYLTFKFKPTKWFTPRITLDTTQESGGDFKVRLKYIYGQLVLPVETDFITEPKVEFGMVHNPWFDFEQSIYRYRAQGTIFIERNKILNSADVGVTFGVLLGSRLSKEYQEKTSKYDPGKWGSLSFGVYNGGGYNAVEKNQNKVFQSRVSLRPLGWVLPNLQLSHLFIFGKGNTPSEICNENDVCKPGEPDWLLNLGMVSFEHEYFNAAVQYARGKGNQKGDRINAAGQALPGSGYSAFLEVKLPWIVSSVIGRYDHFEWDGSGGDRVIAGWAFYFYKDCFLLANIDWLKYENSSKPEDWQVGLVMQVKLP